MLIRPIFMWPVPKIPQVSLKGQMSREKRFIRPVCRRKHRQEHLALFGPFSLPQHNLCQTRKKRLVFRRHPFPPPPPRGGVTSCLLCPSSKNINSSGVKNTQVLTIGGGGGRWALQGATLAVSPAFHQGPLPSSCLQLCAVHTAVRLTSSSSSSSSHSQKKMLCVFPKILKYSFKHPWLELPLSDWYQRVFRELLEK